MTSDTQLAWKATKLAVMVFGGFAAFFFAVIGLTWAAAHFLGGGGVLLLYLAFVFGVIWICALLGIRGKEDRAADTPAPLPHPGPDHG